MELADGTKDVVDPEVRAYVSSLVSALGGSGADEDGRYILGDDALACLRDLKRWLKLYDEKANRLDVARCLAESNLVGGDLLQILAAWPENATDDKIKAKIALACLELLVPLTWPIERDVHSMTVNHHRHIPYLQLAQLGYKRSIINYDGARILHTAVRIALPPMAQAPGDRSTRDQGIIKLLLYFLRNIAMIAPSPNTQYDGDETEISRSATIDAFNWQDIFHLLLTLSSSMGEDFNVQDVIVMEILFHLIKGVDINKLFMDEAQLDMSKTDDLVALRNKEAGMKRGYQRTAPTRHNRFGTMIWIKRDDAKVSTVSGQDVLVDRTKGLAKMDKSKKYKPPRRTPKGESGPMDFDTPVALNAQANKHLRSFVEDFLDSGFNPLFQHIQKAIDREAERITENHPRQFFFLVSWFLEAERVRRKSKKPTKDKKTGVVEVDSFALVAAVLNQEMFITLNRTLQATYDNKAWQDLNAVMKCFTQILLTVQEMSESPLEEDQDIAENILNRIFYEETTHDRVAAIVRFYKDQGFGYLDSATELAHVYLRMLEAYSKQNVDMQVRSRRRTRRKKKAAKEAGDDVGDDGNDEGDGVGLVDESDGEDETRAEQTSTERKFDFKRFASRFLTQGCVDTFVTFCRFYNDLNPEQLKRVHRFFYRVAFKMEMSVMLFRVDIIALFYKMVKGPEEMDPAMSSYKEWDELVKQLIKRCTRKIEERPELIVEMLFSKTNSTAHFLEYGYEKQTSSAKPRPAAELEVKGDYDWAAKVGVVVSYLLDKNMGHHIEWVKGQLSSAESERRNWEAANAAIASVEDPFTDETSNAVTEIPAAPSILLKSDNEERKIAIFKNGYLRLLMTLIGFQSSSPGEEDPTTSWLVPSALSAGQLQESLDIIKKHEFDPPTFDDGKEAEDFIRRKSAATSSRKKAVFDDDDLIDDAEEDFLFPMGGPTAMKPSEALQALKKSRRKRRRDSDDSDIELSDEARLRLQELKREKELEKQRKIKSALFVHDSDEESDVEKDRAFFEREEKLRKKVNVEVMKELLGVKQKELFSAKRNEAAKMKRKAAIDSDDELLTSRRSTTLSDDELGGDLEDTPLSSPHLRSSQNKRPRPDSEDEDEDVEMGMESPARVDKAAVAVEVDDDEDEVVVARPARKRTRGGFISDSSDEE